MLPRKNLDVNRPARVFSRMSDPPLLRTPRVPSDHRQALVAVALGPVQKGVAVLPCGNRSSAPSWWLQRCLRPFISYYGVGYT